jgi:type IV pilus assembly protein PilV
MNSSSTRPAKQSGVTLIENMVALLILSFGLLGMAGLQVYTLRGESSSSYRMLAIRQAADMADRIRANVEAVYSNPAGAQYLNVKPSSSPTLGSNPDCSTAFCTPTQQAAYDVYEWQVQNNELFFGDHNVVGGYVVGQALTDANGNTTPLFGGGPNRMRFSITMRWDGERTGSTNTDCDGAFDSKDPASNPLSCYVLVVDP